MDQELIIHPNVTPSRYPTKFWGLFGGVAHIPHTTQHNTNFLIGQFAKSDGFHWSRHILQHLKSIYLTSPDKLSSTHILLTHTYSMSISHLVYVSLGICYQSYSTTGKYSHITRYTPSVGVMRYLNQYQLILHKIIITYTSLHILFGNAPHFFHRKPWPCDNSLHKARDNVTMGPEKELICLVSVIS